MPPDMRAVCSASGAEFGADAPRLGTASASSREYMRWRYSLGTCVFEGSDEGAHDVQCQTETGRRACSYTRCVPAREHLLIVPSPAPMQFRRIEALRGRSANCRLERRASGAIMHFESMQTSTGAATGPGRRWLSGASAGEAAACRSLRRRRASTTNIERSHCRQYKTSAGH